MTNEQIELLIKQELGILEGWMQLFDVALTYRDRWDCKAKIAECNARLEKLETMRVSNNKQEN